ncbi:MAG TPA: VWA domain-containing protein [Blastocatellia bacterium]|nr:VWA domain-containing protein [Blastocatellia bacterium]
MLRYYRVPVAIILAAILAAAPSLAQQGEQTLKLTSDLVVVDVTVMDKNGNFIRDLKAEDFAIYEDGELQKLDFFEASEQVALTRPLAVVFALDISGSVTPEEIDKQRQATESFMKLVQPESVFAVVAFNHEIHELQGFTSDPNKIRQAFQKIKKPEGLTRIFATLDKSVTMLKRAPRFRNGRRLRRVVIVITDGYDSADSVDQSFLIQRANEAEVTVYSVTLPSYSPGLAGNRVMTLLDVSEVVPKTGGKDFSADAKDFTPAFKAIAEEIRHGYTLAYYPPDKSRRDGRVHQIRVEVKRPGTIVRASRTSYQAGQ